MTGLTPLPNSGSVRSAVRMSIEQVPSVAAEAHVPAAGTTSEGPVTLDWTWCA